MFFTLMRNDFDARSVEYRQFRPGYPEELCDYVMIRCGLQRGSRVLDVGAGTGKASASMVDRGIWTLSVEQSFAMIQQGLEAYPRFHYVCANAETLAVASDTFDLITSAQAFHLFDPQRALPEFARALKRSAFLALFWYRVDLSFGHTRDIDELLGSFDTTCRRLEEAHSNDWTTLIEGTGLFAIVDRPSFSFVVPMTADDWVGLARTIPHLRASGEEFEDLLRSRLAPYPVIDCPYVTDFWLAQKV
jgi:SAM-dependent methyltransferase